MATTPLSRPHSAHPLASSCRPTSFFVWIRVLIVLIAVSSLLTVSLAAATTAPHPSNNPTTLLAERDIIDDAANNTLTIDLAPRSKTNHNENHPPTAPASTLTSTPRTETETEPNPSGNPDTTAQENSEQISPTTTAPAQILPFPIPYWLYDTPVDALGGGLMVGILGTCALWAVIFGVKAGVWCVARVWRAVGRLSRRRGRRGVGRSAGVL